MENPKDQSSSKITTTNNNENPTNITDQTSLPSSLPRTPFTNLSQVDADLALARTLQQQERAYMMLTMNGGGSDHESWETGSFVDDDEFDLGTSEYDAVEEEDAFDPHAHPDTGFTEEDMGNQDVELDPASFPNDDAYARALQHAQGQEMAARLLTPTGINGMVAEEEHSMDDHGGDSQDSYDDVDPDELSYEELIALGEVVGTESRGLSADSIASLCSVIYKKQNSQSGSSETCVICRLEYEDGDNLTLLSCKHSYHSACITNWLQINKACPVCSTEVSTSSTAC